MALALVIQKTRLRDLLQCMYEERLKTCEEQVKDMLEDVKKMQRVSLMADSVNCKLLRNHLQVNINFYAVSIAARDLYESTDSKLALNLGWKLIQVMLLYSFSLFFVSFEVPIEEKIMELEGRFRNEVRCFSKGLLQEYVQSLLDEGIINDQFASVQTLKSANEHDAIIKLITSYFVDVEAVLSEITRSIDSPEADFDQLAAQANTIKEKSLCIGADHMKLACDNLIRACEEKQRPKFSQALDWMKLEFAQTRDKLDAVFQMEKRILRLESRMPK